MRQITNYSDFWIKVIIVTAASWPAGIFIAKSIAQILNWNVSEVILLIWIGIGAGLLLAIAQRLIAENQIGDFRIWLPATTLGAVIGLTVTTSIVSQSSTGWTWIIAGALGGLVLGITQSLCLQAGWREKVLWILLTSVSWALAYTIGLALIQEYTRGVTTDSTAAILMTWITGWGVMGMLTSLAMIALAPIENQQDRSIPMQWC
jgi:hypothetical protein